jgi:cysteinyl-tRNA synthetase
MDIYLTNTLTGKLEKFVPLEKDIVKIYVCGPTVYSPAHIGHARTYVAFDVIIRFFEYLGYTVFYVRNYTDVGHLTEEGEDKIIKGAKREQIHPMELVDKYINEFEEEMKALNIKRPNIQPRASGHIIDIIEATKRLIEKGYAYEVDGTVYYDVSKFKEYGKLSKIKYEKLIKHRVEPDPKKRNPADFALWKKADKKYLLKWPSPWGFGFPGWHIECSVMSMKYLGETFDIHGGAQDLIFPHHENEIAQSEALTGKQFVRYWLHTGLLTINGEKMAKSLGNFITIRELLKKYDPEAFRIFVISSHYRSSIDFSEQSMQQAKEKLDKLYNTLENIEDFLNADRGNNKKDSSFESKIEEIKKKFIEALKDDFNTPLALSYLLELSKEINKYISGNNPSTISIEKARDLLIELGKIFGLFEMDKKAKKEVEIIDKIMEIIINIRNELRKQGQYQLSDKIRNSLKDIGIVLEDVGDKTKWKFS